MGGVATRLGSGEKLRRLRIADWPALERVAEGEMAASAGDEAALDGLLDHTGDYCQLDREVADVPALATHAILLFEALDRELVGAGRTYALDALLASGLFDIGQCVLHVRGQADLEGGAHGALARLNRLIGRYQVRRNQRPQE